MINEGRPAKTMTTNEVMAFFAGEKLKQWMKDYMSRPRGKRNKMIVSIVVGERAHAAIPISWNGREEVTYQPIYYASLN